MKKIGFALIMTLCFAALASCAGGNGKTVAYRSDVEVSTLGAAFSAVISERNGLSALGSDQLYYRLEEAESLAVDCFIGYNSSNYDEFGIIKAASSTDAKAIRDKIVGYYFPLKDGFMKNYSADKYEKISGAACEVYGDYVVYAILSPSERTAGLSAVRGMLEIK